MLEISHLVKKFGPFTAVDDVSFGVAEGEVLGFLGPNGAGKSTTMKMITGFLAPTSGTAVVCGYDIEAAPLAAKRRIGYLPEGAPAYPDMTAAEFLDFIAHIRGLRGAQARRRIGYIADLIHIADVMHQPIETLSKGYRRRVGVAQALLHDPPVLILDEPTDGLDPNQKYEMRGIIQTLSPHKAIVISTHLLEEVEAVCSRAMIIARGRILADGTPSELAARSRFHNAVRLDLASSDAAMIAVELRQLPGVASVESAAEDGRASLCVFAQDGCPISDTIVRIARERGWPVTGLYVERGRLDDVFRTITAPTEKALPNAA
jgi:gliding motility-associated transport system ATP-binding protein